MTKEPVEIEFEVHASPQLLYNYIAKPEGLSEWFAEQVKRKGNYFVFNWNDTEEQALILKDKTDKMIRFQWEEDVDTDYFFQFDVMVDDITKDVSLLITDYAEKDEKDEIIRYWTRNINELKHAIGAE